ncbi:Eukaryotic translation initiation factor 4E [Armadillidium nasatum]|uniref:eIF-4F 25 kDa subunit n=2 Tax=Armadillidium nasatum TaxID=96803 RepID=A0A5N5ST68_9CRUS|nr:Eukaryotic translation initiation factor 4E [Armadillidium nasatum]
MAADMEVQNQVDHKEKDAEKQKEKESTEKSLSPEMLIKHPLQNEWTMWFFKQDSTRSWEESQIVVASFDTVEDFWALYNHIELASKLKTGCDYSLFKKGIKPMWEDTRNCAGGRWIINLSKNQRATELDNFWMEMLLLLIGEAFDQDSEEVCGAVVNVRAKGDKVGVWTRDAQNAAGILKIGDTLRRRLNIPHNIQIGYQAHTDSMVKAGSTAKNRYTV